MLTMTPRQVTRAFLLPAFLFVMVAASALAQPSIIVNVDGRSTASLDGNWQVIVDPFENGYYNYRWEPHTEGYFANKKPQTPLDLIEYDFDTSPELAVPGDWNSQYKELEYYESTVWYKKSFRIKKQPGKRL